MRLLSVLTLGGLASGVVGKQNPKELRPRYNAPTKLQYPKRQSEGLVARNEKTEKFVVNGTAGAIPYVDFDIGESYAGLLPIGSAPNASELYFWYFPSENPAASDEIVIWLNGGPGCSSLEGFLQENGPFLWQYGTYKPVPNYWAWSNLTNMVWIEQPVGTGFSQGTPTANSTADAAQEFLGFWKNFMDTFDLCGKTVYITGESFAGMYVPYIADAMIQKNDTDYYNVNGIMIYDPSVADNVVLEDAPAVGLVDQWSGLFNLNETFMEYIHQQADKCGYTSLFDTYLTFPPQNGSIPLPAYNADDDGCDLWNQILNAVLLTNPCFDLYAIATTCPLLWDVLGFPGSIPYLPDGAFIYFNLTDVQKAINAPVQEWEECSNGVLEHDTSLPSSIEVLPQVIDALERTIIVHGELDYVLLYNGTLLTIQNMTFGGLQGFQSKPSDDFFVPYHSDGPLGTISAAGVMGTTHTERKLTWVSQRLSGHMVPQYQPSSAYRQLEFLLGRIESLTSTVPFTTLGQGNSTAKRDVERRGLHEKVGKWY